MEMLAAKKNALESKIASLRQQVAQAARRDDSRRKILLGSAIIAAVDAGVISSDSVVKLLTRFLTRPADRSAFLTGRFQIPAGLPVGESSGSE